MSGPPVEGVPTPPPAGPPAGPLVREKITTTVVEREYALPPPPKQHRLQGLVDGLRIMTFQRFAAAIVIGTVGCTTPGVTGGLRRCCDRTSQTPGSLRAQCNF